MREGELVRAVQRGEREAFGRLVEQHQGLIYRLCFRVTGDVHDAEELAHDAFVEAYLKLDQLRDPERFLPWLKKLALNLCRMWYRRRERDEVELRDEMEEPAAEVPDEVGSISTRLVRSLTRLSPAHRLVVVLHYWEGLSYEDVATFLEVPIGTVMSRLHRARRELKRLVEETTEEEEMSMVPDEAFTREVEAEITVLLTMFEHDPGAMERLSLILRRSPERFVQLIQQAGGETDLDNLALLLGRLGRPAIEAALACYQAAEPALQLRAAGLLRRSMTRGKPPRSGIPAARIARLDAYLLLDLLIEAAMEPDRKVELLVELLAVCSDEQTCLLLTNVLLCYPDDAFRRLTERFWQSPSSSALHRSPDVLWALCRMGTRFAEALLVPLSADEARQRELALEGADGLARSLTGSGLDLDQTPDERVALEARLRRKWAPPLKKERDPVVIQALVEGVSGFLSDERAAVRDKALRVLALLPSDAVREQIRACTTHACPTTRVAALRALGQIGDAGSIGLLCRAAEEGLPAERSVAVWALGRLQVEEALPLLIRLARNPDQLEHPPRRKDDPCGGALCDQDVRGAAITALGEISNDSAREALEELHRSQVMGAGRSLRRIALKQSDRAPEPPAPPRMAERVRDGAEPPFYIALDAAIRALPALQPYDEATLSRWIGQVCYDFASTRRYLVDEGLMHREGGVYRFTDRGETVWRVERFILKQYMR